MLSATVLTVVFATRGAMAGNGHIIEVLHFVGAEARFIAARVPAPFPADRHEGRGRRRRRGASSSSSSSRCWSARNLATPQADQATALFGNFAIGASGYAGVALVVLVIGALTAATSHVTVVAYLTRHRHPPAGRELSRRDACHVRRSLALSNRRNSALTMCAMKGHRSRRRDRRGAWRRRRCCACQRAGCAHSARCRASAFLASCAAVRRRLRALRHPCQRTGDAARTAAQADAIIVLTGGQARLDAALDLLKSGKGKRLLISGVNPAADRDDAAGGDRRRQQAVLLLRRHRPRRARHDRQCRGERQMGAAATPTAASSSSPTTTTCRAACWKCGRLVGKAELEPYPVVNTELDDGGWLTKPEALRVLFTEYTKYLAALARGALPLRPHRGRHGGDATPRPPSTTERARRRARFAFCAASGVTNALASAPGSVHAHHPFAGVQHRLLRQPDRPDDLLDAVLLPVAAPPAPGSCRNSGRAPACGCRRRSPAPEARSPGWRTCRRARFILAPKHQSFWDTIAFFPYLRDPLYILKRELTVDPVLRLVRHEDADDPGRIAAARSKALKAAVADTKREMAQRPPAHHLSRGHAARAGRRAGLQIRHRRALCAARPAGGAGRPCRRPLLAAPQVPALSRHDQGALPAADPGRARPRGVHAAADRRDRGRLRRVADRGGPVAQSAADAADRREAAEGTRRHCRRLAELSSALASSSSGDVGRRQLQAHARGSGCRSARSSWRWRSAR